MIFTEVMLVLAAMLLASTFAAVLMLPPVILPVAIRLPPEAETLALVKPTSKLVPLRLPLALTVLANKVPVNETLGFKST